MAFCSPVCCMERHRRVLSTFWALQTRRQTVLRRSDEEVHWVEGFLETSAGWGKVIRAYTGEPRADAEGKASRVRHGRNVQGETPLPCRGHIKGMSQMRLAVGGEGTGRVAERLPLGSLKTYQPRSPLPQMPRATSAWALGWQATALRTRASCCYHSCAAVVGRPAPSEGAKKGPRALASGLKPPSVAPSEGEGVEWGRRRSSGRGRGHVEAKGGAEGGRGPAEAKRGGDR